MRKTSLFGASILALATGAWTMAAVAQTATPAPAPAAPMAAPAPAPAPMAPAAPEAAPAAPADTSATPAPAAADAAPPKKHMTHHTMSHHGKLAPTKAGNAAVEDLNDASLNAAKSGKPFTAPTTPVAAKKTAHVGDKDAAPMHHHMHKAMKKAKASSDAATPAPAADSSAPAPDATPK